MEFLIQTEDEELKQQLRTLLETRAGSVPVDRDFGMRWEYLDEPAEVAESLFYQELLNKTERYLPKLRIKQVIIQSNYLGAMTALIDCERRGAD